MRFGVLSCAALLADSIVGGAQAEEPVKIGYAIAKSGPFAPAAD